MDMELMRNKARKLVMAREERYYSCELFPMTNGQLLAVACVDELGAGPSSPPELAFHLYVYTPSHDDLSFYGFADVDDVARAIAEMIYDYKSGVYFKEVY